MSSTALRDARAPLLLLLLLAVLLVASVELADLSDGRLVRLGVLALAAAKVALVVSEYVEVRGAARWLVAVWAVWGTGTFLGLALLAVAAA